MIIHINMSENIYSSGKIYKICDNSYNMCYFGSTVQKLTQRMTSHRKDYRQYKSGDKKKYTSAFAIFDEYGIDNCKIELVEVFPCNSKEELHKREGEYIRNNQ